MSPVVEAVAGGFLLASRRLHLVLTDLVAKALWLVLTMLMVSVTILGFLARLAPPTDVPPEVAGLFLGARFLALWPSFLGSLALTCGFSFLIWGVLEASVRSRILRWAWKGNSTGSGTFGSFFASGMVRRLLFGLAAAVLSIILLGPGLTASSGQWNTPPPDLRWEALAVLLLLVMVAFVLMLIDTLLRCDAVETLGRHLGAIVAAVVTIGFIELTVRMAAVAGTIVLMNVFPASLVFFIAVPAVGVGLSALHSYLLLVRYSTIGIMRSQFDSRAITHDGPSYSL